MTRRLLVVPSADAAVDDGNESDRSQKTQFAEKRTSHHARPSLLSTEARGASYRGLLNLGIIVLVLSNFQEIVRNFQKYGILVNPASVVQDVFHDPHSWPSVELFASCVASLVH